MKKSIHIHYVLILLLSSIGFESCRKDFLNTVPDDIQTMENIFSKRNLSEDWLAAIYSYIDDPWKQPHVFNWDNSSDDLQYQTAWGYNLALNSGGLNPDANAGPWNHYQAIRNATIYIKNIGNNQEMKNLPNGETLIKNRIGEARFLRAYYYFKMMKVYGPMILMGDELRATDADFNIPRSSWPECIAYIIKEMDQALTEVPETHLLDSGEPDLIQTGRITKAIVLATKSQVLLYDASPLFNGNTDMAGLKNKDGKALIPQTYDRDKWRLAADAAKAVIDLNKYSLYATNDPDPFRAAYLSSRNLYWDGWQSEGIWLRPSSEFNSYWERHNAPRIAAGNAWSGIGVTQELVDEFRMANGKDINDPSSGYQESGFASSATPYYVQNTFNMYIGREPRFYAFVTFNGALSPVVNRAAVSGDVLPLRVEYFRAGNSGKGSAPRDWSMTGYTARKNIHPNTNFQTGTRTNRPAMLIRLAEIYLNYIEALNEYDPTNPDVLKYLNMIRNRGGLPNLSSGLSQDEMRDEIHKERRIELCFEMAHRFFDIRRWKEIPSIQSLVSGQIHGMNVNEGTSITDTKFYQRVVAERRAPFQRKYYFYPIPQRDIDRNTQLVQNPGY